MKKEEIASFIINELATILNLNPDDIDPDVHFLRIGITSLQTLKIINKISRKLQIDINPVAMFEYKTISEFSGYLSETAMEAGQV